MTKWEYKIINIRSENYRLDPNAAPQLLPDEGRCPLTQAASRSRREMGANASCAIC